MTNEVIHTLPNGVDIERSYLQGTTAIVYYYRPNKEECGHRLNPTVFPADSEEDFKILDRFMISFAEAHLKSPKITHFNQDWTQDWGKYLKTPQP